MDDPASAVVGDLMEIAREIRRGGSGLVAPLSYLPDHLVQKPQVPTAKISQWSGAVTRAARPVTPKPNQTSMSCSTGFQNRSKGM